ncbi:MAG: hypothetical protein LBI14_03500 [Treponema sp.]|jgi:hypothetical protein|nr:hypothetical protein [Treponema sp.]
MKRYCIKSRSGRIEYFDILHEDEEGYKVKLTRISDGNEKITETFLSRPLFELCQKTGYIFEQNQVA